MRIQGAASDQSKPAPAHPEIALEELRASLELATGLIRSMQDGFSVVGADGVQLEVNPAFCRMTGFSREELVGLSPPFPYWPPEEHEPINAAFRATLDGNFRDFELTFMRRNGERFPVLVNPSAIKNREGSTINYIATVKDISERKQTERLLEWEKEALELISSAASLPDVLDGLMLGLEKQLPGSLCSVLLLDADGVHLRHGAAPKLPEAYNRAVDGGVIGPAAGSCGTAAFLGRQIIVADIGTDPLWADYRELALGHGLRACFSTPILDNEEKVLGTFAIYHPVPRHPLPDELAVVARAVHITRIAIERKRAETALRESETKYRMLFETAGDAIFLVDGELSVDCNERALKMLGCGSRDQIVGQPPHRFSPPFQPSGRDSREAAIEKISAALGGRPQAFEWMHIRHDGTPFPTAVSLNAVEIGGRVLLQAIVRDISERRRSEEVIRRQNEELELRVEQRTSELSKANRELRHHIVTRRHLEKEIIEICEGERKRIGQDLHDDLGQQLGGIWCLSQALESSLVAQKSPEATFATKITSRLKESLELTRTLARGLYPVALQADGLSSALDELAQRTSEMFGVSCRCRCPQKLDMDYTIAAHLYRIAQEAVTNAIKHGHAQNVGIEFSSGSHHTILTVTNDGMPMVKSRTKGAGMGLRIMRYRAATIGGRLSIKSSKVIGGTNVTCTIPTVR